MKPNVIFMGTPDFAVPILDTLYKLTNVLLVVTQPDKTVGRKQEIKYSPVKEKAIEYNIPVFQPKKIKEDYKKIINEDIDLIVTCAYGQILPVEILKHPKIASINVHASLLPKLRGGAPINRAIIDGYTESGITIMYMAEGMDSGDIISKAKTNITYEDTAGTLYERLKEMAPKLLEETLPSILNGTNSRTHQDEDEVTYAPIIKREDEHIDFNKNCEEIIRLIKGLNPYPLSNVLINGEEFKIIEAHYIKRLSEEPSKLFIDKNEMGITCKDGIILFDKIKPFGKKAMLTKDYLNGLHDLTKNWSVK